MLVGDGFTDLQVYQSKLVDYFIAYTEHVNRQEVVALASYQVNNIDDLKFRLKKILIL